MTSAPWSRIRPAVGSSKPAIIRSVVVLPEPGRTEHREELAVADVEVDAVDRDDVAVAASRRASSRTRDGAPSARRLPASGADRRGRGVGRDRPSRDLDSGVPRSRRVGRSRGDGPGTVPSRRGRMSRRAGRRSGAASAPRRRLPRVRPSATAPRPLARPGRRSPPCWRRLRRRGGAGRRRRRSSPGRRTRRARSTSSPGTTRSCPPSLDLVPGETDPAPRHQRRPRGPRGGHRRRRRSRTPGRSPRRATVGAPPGPTPVVSGPARTSPASGSSSTRASASTCVWTVPPTCRRGVRGRRRRRIPAPGSSAATSRATGPKGMRIPIRWVARARHLVSARRWYALAPRRAGDARAATRSLEEDPE